jgi:hypothetical protein
MAKRRPGTMPWLEKAKPWLREAMARRGKAKARPKTRVKTKGWGRLSHG